MLEEGGVFLRFFGVSPSPSPTNLRNAGVQFTQYLVLQSAGGIVLLQDIKFLI